MTLDNDKLLGFQFDITVIPSLAGSICRYMNYCAADVGGVSITHMKWGSSTIVKPITVRNLNLYITYKQSYHKMLKTQSKMLKTM